MAEVGLLPFARIALQVAKAVLPRYRSRFSKHQFTQPQLLTILCLMRYEDWTFREAEVRLGEHRELRQALGLTSVPDFTTLYRFLQRLDDQIIDQAVGETVRRLHGARRKGRRRARVGVDATGLAQGAVSTFFVRRLHHHGQKPLPWRHWLKWVIVADLDQQFLLSQSARRGPWNDCANLPTVVEAAAQQTRIGLVLADDPGQARKENLARSWSACRNAAGVSEPALPTPCSNRERLLFGQTQALGSRPRPQLVHASTPSPVARPEFQSLGLKHRRLFPEDVNRAKPFHNTLSSGPRDLRSTRTPTPTSSSVIPAPRSDRDGLGLTLIFHLGFRNLARRALSFLFFKPFLVNFFKPFLEATRIFKGVN